MSKIILNGVNYSELNQNRPLVRQNEIGKFASIHLMNELKNAIGYIPYELVEITYEPVEVPMCTTFDGVHPWIDIPWSVLNQNSGLHTYVMKFYHKYTYESKSAYFSYLFQTHDTPKDYVYMNRK